MRTPSSHINSWTHNSCEREEYAIMVLQEYLIIFLLLQLHKVVISTNFTPPFSPSSSNA